MDPNEALLKAREAAEHLQQELDSDDPHSSTIEAHATELLEHFQALDEWLSRGGFAPESWTP